MYIYIQTSDFIIVSVCSYFIRLTGNVRHLLLPHHEQARDGDAPRGRSPWRQHLRQERQADPEDHVSVVGDQEDLLHQGQVQGKATIETSSI